MGIIIDRGGTGLRAWIIVRNVIDGLGVEFMYDLYSPTVKEIEVLRLEKRIDDELYYLRDCDPKHSTFPVDMQAELLADGQSVPVNEDVLPLRPFPWSRKWHRYADRLFGYSFDQDQVPHRLQKQYDAYSAYFNYVSIYCSKDNIRTTPFSKKKINFKIATIFFISYTLRGKARQFQS